MTESIMNNLLQKKLSDVKRLLIFRALNVGDMLCCVPALRALRARFPRAWIGLLGLPWAQSFAKRFDRYLDQFIPFTGFPGLPEQEYDEKRFAELVAVITKSGFDFAIQMHGSGETSNKVLEALAIPLSAGFYPAGGDPPDPQTYLPYPESLSEVERNLLLIRNLGFPVLGTELEFPIKEEDGTELSVAPELKTLRRGSYVCIHPGARARDKCWPIENFGMVARAVSEMGFKVVVTGNRYESDLAAAITMGGCRDCIDAASLDLSLGSLALLIRDARLVVCNDTGVSHLASALAVPSVVIFTRTDPRRWAPLDRKLHRALGEKDSPPLIGDVLNDVRTLLKIEY